MENVQCVEYVENYKSDDECLEISQEVPKRRQIEWEKVKTFQNNSSALAAIDKENTWGKSSKYTDCNGYCIVKYRCNKVKLRGKQCSAALRLIYDAQNGEVSLYRSMSGHDHDTIISKSNARLTLEMKTKINNLFENDLRIKPKQVIQKLIDDQNVTLPKTLQVSNYLAILRKDKFGPCTLSLGKLEKILASIPVIQESDIAPFILNFEINYEEETFKICVSSRLLLKNHSKTKLLHVDATYKLVWQGFPVLLVGSTDAAKQFHVICIAVSTGETYNDFEFIFNSLKDKYMPLFGIEFSPHILVSDAAVAISKAFQNVFREKEPTCITCWFHVLKNIDSKLRILVKDKTNKSLILEDIHYLQLSKSKEIFDKASNLFVEKWNLKAGEFCSYFKEQWLAKNSNWYEGIIRKIPKTNNALEATNKIIKDEHTMRERLPINQFVNVMMTFVEQWGQSYENKIKVIKTLPDITLSVLTKAYQWAREDKQIRKKVSHNKQIFMIPGKSYKHIEHFMVNDFNCFDEFKSNCFSHYEVVLYENEDILNGHCDCPSFFKDYICKHIVGLGIRLKLLFPPAEAKNIPIGLKRKRGRPSKAKKALITQ